MGSVGISVSPGHDHRTGQPRGVPHVCIEAHLLPQGVRWPGAWDGAELGCRGDQPRAGWEEVWGSSVGSASASQEGRSHLGCQQLHGSSLNLAEKSP